MTDRELLEHAAKAAGISFDEKGKSKFGLWLTIDFEPSEHTRRRWNPLADDGDALRLAVKLRIKFRYNEALGQALAWTGGINDFEARANIEDCGKDEFACARRAIVRAAAGIGKETK